MRSDPSSFDRSSLTAAASLNELVLQVGPYRGQSAVELLSRDAVAALAPDLDPSRLTDELVARPERLDAIGTEVGKRVAALISSLRRGLHDLPPEEQSTERTRALDEWRVIDDVVLGGGLLAGRMGPVVLAHVRTNLDNEAPTHVSVSRHAPWLGLVGAARTCSEGEHLVIDGGQTAIKPAVAEIGDGHLRRLRVLPTVPLAQDDDVAALLSSILSKHAEWVSDEIVPCSIAAYVRDGRPITFRGNSYEQLATAPKSLLNQLRLLHDGAAAWRGTGRHTSSAVIVMGTFLGVGMGPHVGVEPLRPIGAHFEVVPVTGG